MEPPSAARTPRAPPAAYRAITPAAVARSRTASAAGAAMTRAADDTAKARTAVAALEAAEKPTIARDTPTSRPARPRGIARPRFPIILAREPIPRTRLTTRIACQAMRPAPISAIKVATSGCAMRAAERRFTLCATDVIVCANGPIIGSVNAAPMFVIADLIARAANFGSLSLDCS